MAKLKAEGTLAIEADVSQIREIQARVEKNSDIINSIVDKLVQDYCKPLDDYIKFIKVILDDVDNPPLDRELDDFTLNIPVLLYFTGEAQETLGIKEDVAKAMRMELYNDSFDKAAGTIADKTALAELKTMNEQIAHIAYQRAYKKVKLRMEAGNEILQSIKKVMTRRISEYELSRVDPGRVGGR